MYDTGKLIDFQLNLLEWNQIEKKTENCYPEDNDKDFKGESFQNFSFGV